MESIDFWLGFGLCWWFSFSCTFGIYEADSMVLEQCVDNAPPTYRRIFSRSKKSVPRSFFTCCNIWNFNSHFSRQTSNSIPDDEVRTTDIHLPMECFARNPKKTIDSQFSFSTSNLFLFSPSGLTILVVLISFALCLTPWCPCDRPCSRTSLHHLKNDSFIHQTVKSDERPLHAWDSSTE